VLVDSKLHRTSGLTEATVLTLKGREVPLPMLPILLAAGGGVFLLVGIALLLRRGAKKASVTSSRSPRLSEDSPYARPAPVTRGARSQRAVTRAVLEGNAGRFLVLPGTDLRAGRDGARAAALISNSQVSGLHATFRVENNVLMVRDESSTSGTRLNGRLLVAGQWEQASDGAEIALGPEAFRVTLETTQSKS